MRSGLEQGLATITDPDGIREVSTFTCNHCNRIVHVKTGASPTDLGGMCGHCKHLICSECVEKGICDPFMDQFARMEAALDARRSYGF